MPESWMWDLGRRSESNAHPSTPALERVSLAARRDHLNLILALAMADANVASTKVKLQVDRQVVCSILGEHAEDMF